MGKIVYVNGYIIVKTQYFLPKEVGYGYATPPEGTTMVVEPEDVIEAYESNNMDYLYNQAKKMVELQKIYKELLLEKVFRKKCKKLTLIT